MKKECCSKERVEIVLKSLGKEQLSVIIEEDKKAEVVCPYCNQNHLNVVYEKTGKIRFWGDLDHFYDKSTYPELSVCLYANVNIKM